MKFSEKIINIRKEKNLTQEELAELLNVSRQTVSNWETNKCYPDIETFILISDKFKISLDVLLKEDKEMIKKLNKKISKETIIIYCILFLTILFLGGIIGYGIWDKYKTDQAINYFKEKITETDSIIVADRLYQNAEEFIKENNSNYGIITTITNKEEIETFTTYLKDIAKTDAKGDYDKIPRYLVKFLNKDKEIISELTMNPLKIKGVNTNLDTPNLVFENFLNTNYRLPLFKLNKDIENLFNKTTKIYLVYNKEESWITDQEKINDIITEIGKMNVEINVSYTTLAYMNDLKMEFWNDNQSLIKMSNLNFTYNDDHYTLIPANYTNFLKHIV